ncbi:MAG: carbohydrate ABC transporter permease [Halobacteriales archaeon]
MSVGVGTRAVAFKETLEEMGARRVGLYAILVVMIAFYMTPIETGLMTSLKADTGTTPFVPPAPGNFTIENWVTAFDSLARGLANSLMMAVPATIISALLGSFTAYGLTKADWRGQSAVLALLVAGIFIPYQSVLVPLSRFWGIYLNLKQLLAPVWALSFLTTAHADLLALIITHAAYGVPLMTLLFRSHYQTISDEMMEAARLDGASFACTYWKIIVPLSTPMFAVALIFQFTQIWNDLLFALILVSSEGSPVAPVTLILAGFGQSQSGLDFGLRMAGALLTALPPLLVYVFFGDEFAEGVAR